MKKILLFTSILFFAFSLKTVHAQTPDIDSVAIDQEILCYGDKATVTCWVDGVGVPLPVYVQYINYRFSNATLLLEEGFSDTATNEPSWQFANSLGNANFIIGGNKRAIIVDSTDFANATNGMSINQISDYIRTNTDLNFDPNDNTNNVPPLGSPILHFFDYIVYDVNEIDVNTSPTAFNLCQGDCDAGEDILISGGTPSYELNVTANPQITPPYDFTETLSAYDTSLINLCGAVLFPNGGQTYNISVTDINGCTGSGSFTVIDPDTLIPTGWVDSLTWTGFEQISCYGESDGVITPQTTGGTSPYIRFEMITPPPFPLWPYTPSGNPFDTIFSSPFPITEITGLDSGSYYIYYIDDNGCDTFQVLTLTYPDSLSGTVATLTDATCNGYSDGEIEFTVDVLGPGTPFTGNLYEYSIDSGLTFPIQDISPYPWPNLAAGWYYTVIRDANGCEFHDSVFVDEPTAIVFTAAAQDFLGFQISCWRAMDGKITIDNPTGGAGSYDFSIDGGITWVGTNVFPPFSPPGLDIGTYVVSVQDADGCPAPDTTIIIAEPDSFSITSSLTAPGEYNGFDVSCPDACDGKVTVTPTNGVPSGPITYYLSSLTNGPQPPQSSTQWTTVCGDTNTIIAEDYNGCLAYDTIVLSVSPSWAYTVDSINESCHNENGEASINITGGLSGAENGAFPWNYTYDWACLPINSCWQFPGVPGGNFPTATFLDSGMYQVTVTDDNGCELIEDILVGESYLPLTFDSVIPPCNNLPNGTATVIASPPTNITPTYMYQWYAVPGMILISGATNAILTGQPPGFYAVQVIATDIPNSYVCQNTDTVEIPSTLIVTVFQPLTGNFDIACFGDTSTGVTAIGDGGAVDVTLVPAGSGYTYVWTTVTPPIDTVDITQIATHLVAGDYFVSAMDTNGCSSLSPYQFTINEPATPLSITFTPPSTPVYCHGDSTGTAVATATGGTPFVYTSSQDAFDVLWNDPYAQSNPTTNSTVNTVVASAFDLPSDWYAVTFTDSNNCSVIDSVDITEPNALTTSYTQDSAWCVGGDDGWAKVSVSGGVGPYYYLWDNAMTNDSAYNLTAGWHTVTITDSQLPIGVGCTLLDSVLILGPSAPFQIDSLGITEITCYGAENAIIKVYASGGGAYKPYRYSNDNGLLIGPNFAFTNLTPNTYIMYAIDQKGCIDRDTIDIVEPDLLYIDDVFFVDVQCYGMDNGSIYDIIGVGGTLPYEYSVGTGPHYTNMGNFNGYAADDYMVNIFDANNCANQYQITITEPNELDVTVSPYYWDSPPTYEIQCHGDSLGFANITVAGGLSPYTYTALDINNNLDTIEGTPYPLIPSIGLIDSLYAGTYTFTITDSNECESATTIIYDEPSLIEHNFIATHISCSGWSTGSLIDSVSGGNGTATSYIYSWNTGDNTYSLTSLDTGTYIMTVEDENGCISIDTATINYVDTLNITATGTDVSCHGYCDGEIITTVTGGMPNIDSFGLPVYTYLWNDILPQITATAVGLCVNNTLDSSTYICVVEDQQGCTDTVEYTLYQNDTLSVTASILSEITCFGASNGKASAIPAGGTPPYTYEWSDGSTDSINNSLLTGNHVVTVKDARGCMDTAQIYLTEPDALSITLSGEQDVNCFGDSSGTITADAGGGSPFFPLAYNYVWDNGFTDLLISSSTATYLVPGIYTVTAEDAHGCIITSESVYITGPANPLSISVDSTDETCLLNDGSANAFVLGGTLPFAYDWTGPGGFSATGGGKLITNLSPGLYTVNVTDGNGCLKSETTIVNGVRNIFYTPENYADFDSSVCLGTSVFLDVEEKPDLNYVWEDSSTIADRWVEPTNPVNIYTLSITDPSCVNSYTVTAIINVIDVPVNLSTDNSSHTYALHFLSPPSFPITVDPITGDTLRDPIHTVGIANGSSITLFSDNNNCDSYNWTWIDGNSSTQSILANPAEESGWYYITVDSSSCLGIDSIYVFVRVNPFDAISPNDDGLNDDWGIVGIENYNDAVVQIFNRWGGLVHETSGGLGYIAWDGTRNGKELPAGTYYYIIDLKNGNEPQTGPITIIR